MHGLVVIEGMTLSGHPWIINEMLKEQVFADSDASILALITST